MKDILITHGYSDSNKGDLAIVMGTIIAIKELLPDSNIKLHSVYSEDDPDFVYHSRFISKMGIKVEEGLIPSPYIDDKKHSIFRNIEASFRLFKSIITFHAINIAPKVFKKLNNRQYEAIQSVKKSNVVIAKGGQYIYNDQGGMRGFLYLWRILQPINYAIKSKKKVAILGKSIGPFTGDYALKMFRKAVKGIDLILVREKKSEKLLKSNGIVNNVVLAPDMAFLIEPNKPKTYEEKFAYLEEGNWIGVTVVNWYFPNHPNLENAKKQYKEKIIEVIKNVHEELKMNIVFFPQVTVKHHGESDLDLIDELVKELFNLGVEAKTVKEDISPMELSYLYGKCNLLLGTRLHSCILASCANTPVVAIRYQGFKTEGVMEELGLAKYVHDINHIDSNKLFLDIKENLDNNVEIKKIIAQNVNNHRSYLRNVLKDFFVN